MLVRTYVIFDVTWVAGDRVSCQLLRLPLQPTQLTLFEVNSISKILFSHKRFQTLQFPLPYHDGLGSYILLAHPTQQIERFKMGYGPYSRTSTAHYLDALAVFQIKNARENERHFLSK